MIKKIHPLTVVMKGKISDIHQNHFLHQAVNILFSAVKLDILTWGVYGIDYLLEPASSGQAMNYSFSHVRVGFTRERARGYRLAKTSYFTFIRLQMISISINCCSFELSVHLSILKNTMHHSLQKYWAAQLYSTLIIIITFS